ncbi:MAG: hypothetical protein K6F21_01725 [Bacteroidales bacterium]|nr:hypothetical protein [Bacteroidales bacterium]
MDLYHGLYVNLDKDAIFRPAFVEKYTYYRDKALELCGEDYPLNYREVEKKYARSMDFEKALHLQQEVGNQCQACRR